VVGHLILFFGLPFLSFGIPKPIAEDLIIRTELKNEPPKKIQMARAAKKVEKNTTSSKASEESSPNVSGQQGALGDQAGVAFKLPASGIIYYDS
jgi:hypothetical protein